MTNPAKMKGSQWERDIVSYLVAHGFPYAERRYGAGATLDKGDITGVMPGLVIEAKNHQKLDLAGWIGEAERERINAKAKVGVVIAKRRGKSAEHGYVIMTLATFADLLKDDF